jgi:hypothetical protein
MAYNTEKNVINTWVIIVQYFQSLYCLQIYKILLNIYL